MQIKKELGQIPADTVIHYQEDMIVKPKVKIEPTEEESIDETPQSTNNENNVLNPTIVKQEVPDTEPNGNDSDQQVVSQESATQEAPQVKVEVTEAS